MEEKLIARSDKNEAEKTTHNNKKINQFKTKRTAELQEEVKKKKQANIRDPEYE